MNLIAWISMLVVVVAMVIPTVAYPGFVSQVNSTTAVVMLNISLDNNNSTCINETLAALNQFGHSLIREYNPDSGDYTVAITIRRRS